MCGSSRCRPSWRPRAADRHDARLPPRPEHIGRRRGPGPREAARHTHRERATVAWRRPTRDPGRPDPGGGARGRTDARYVRCEHHRPIAGRVRPNRNPSCRRPVHRPPNDGVAQLWRTRAGAHRPLGRTRHRGLGQPGRLPAGRRLDCARRAPSLATEDCAQCRTDRMRQYAPPAIAASDGA